MLSLGTIEMEYWLCYDKQVEVMLKSKGRKYMKRSSKVWVSVILSIACIATQISPIGTVTVKSEEKGTYAINDYVNNEALVRLKKSCTKSVRNSLFKSLNVSLTEEMDQYAVIKAGTRTNLQKALKSLNKNTYVEHIQPNFQYSSSSYNGSYANNDIQINQTQWALRNDGTSTFTNGYPGNRRKQVKCVKGMDLNVTPLWHNVKGKKSKNVIVAVLDTGLDVEHPVLKGKLRVNTKEVPDDGIDNDNNGFDDDYYGWNSNNYNGDLTDEVGHGTHCAGIIAANGTDNVWGVTGKSNVKIMPVKVFADKKSKLMEPTASSFSLIRGIMYAVKNGASICSMSLGMPESDEELEECIRSSKMLFVCAAGNESDNLEEFPMYPACYHYSNVITVGNIMCDGTLHDSSSYSKKYVDVAAPGTDIYSTVPNGKYAYYTGTSMATPYVAGTAALLYSYSDKMSPQAAKKQIVRNAEKIDTLKGKINSGLVNAFRAYQNDVSAPYIGYKVSPDKQKGNSKVALDVVDYGIAGVKYVRWLSGNKTSSAFKKGTAGYKYSKAGYFTAKRTGAYTIYAIDKKGNETARQIYVNVPGPKSIKLSASTLTLKKGASYKMKVSSSPRDSYVSYTYTTSNKGVAVVDQKGKITAKKKGIAVITVKTQNGVKKTCKVTVK